MKNYYLILVAATLVSSVFGGIAFANDGQTVPKPVFQLGDNPSKPLPDAGPGAQAFIDFFNLTYQSQLGPSGQQLPEIPVLTKDEVVWFPPQRAGDTSLELVSREVVAGANCDPSDPGFPPQGYPLVCGPDNFSTGQFCQACHDSALYVEGGGIPEMMYVDEHQEWLANWSQYGDWSASIMRLATRDPVWQAQIETETNVHENADPYVIQDVCFSCHGEMGERQLKIDILKLLNSDDLKSGYITHLKKLDPQNAGLMMPITDSDIANSNPHFCTDVFYSTLPGLLGDAAGGKPYPYDENCAPIAGLPVKDHPELYAKYGALARDGVSCETCHRIGPDVNKVEPADWQGPGQWNGTDFGVLYGQEDLYQVEKRQTRNPVPLEYEFTANFQYDMDHIMAPDPIDTLDTGTMLTYDNLNLVTATNTAAGEDDVSYLRQGVLCGACHVLIVPQIPESYAPGGPLPDPAMYPNYERPQACMSDTFSTENTRTVGDKTYGNPLLDPCVGLGYEQATYLEWINSDFATTKDSDTTCQGCHMPLVTNPSDPTDHNAIMAQSTAGLTGKTYRRHRMMGINLPVSEMFMQFPDVLGVFPYSDNVPSYAQMPNGNDVRAIQNYLLNGQMAIVEQATSQANGTGLLPDTTTPDPQAAVEITGLEAEVVGDALLAEMRIVNNTGHKFPSGAGFRRAFVKFEVLDGSGNVIWVSGQANPFGAICQGACIKDPHTGLYNLLPSEVNTTGNPTNLQPHYTEINLQSQVQIYEIQTANDAGKVTSSTLALFKDVKDNRLLPRGYQLADRLGCPENSNSIFGINICSAAYATEPVLDSKIPGSQIANDTDYTSGKSPGFDDLAYVIPLSDIDGTAVEIRVSIEYQTIPPGYLSARFSNGHTEEGFLPATERAIYLTSHLNLDLDLKSQHPDNPDVTFSQNWTSTIHQASASVGLVPDGVVPEIVSLSPVVPTESAGRPANCSSDVQPLAFFESEVVPFEYSGTGTVYLAGSPDGTGGTLVDDEAVLHIFDPQSETEEQAKFVYSPGCIVPEMMAPQDVTSMFTSGQGTYFVQLELVDLWGVLQGSSTDIFLVEVP